MTVASHSASLWSGILLTALLWAFAWATPSIEMDYCATINTASGAANHSIYQSDGLCHEFCLPKWAIAIVKGDSCWCSNFVPDESVQVDISQCSRPCPGYITDVCGGDTEYGYMLLAKSPSGTVGGPSSTTAAPAPATTSIPVQVTTHLLTSVVQQTVQQTVRATVTYTPPSSASSSTRQSSSSPTSAPANEQTASQATTSASTTSSSSTTEPPQRTTVTVGGTVKTIVITPSASPQGSSLPSSANINSSGTKHGLSAGAAAGVAIAVIVILLAIGCGIAWFLIKRRRKAAAGLGGPSSLGHRGSSSGIMAAPGISEVAETRYYMGPPTKNDDNSPPGPERRRSTLMPVDPRLDPFSKGIYNRTENRSHESVNTLEDNQDYSRRIQEPPRVLRAINPDPDYD